MAVSLIEKLRDVILDLTLSKCKEDVIRIAKYYHKRGREAD